MIRTFLTVALVWLLGSWIASIYPTPWAAWAGLAALACVIITIHPSGRWQAAIGGSFLATLIVHIAFGISFIMERNVSAETYLNSLDRLNIIRVGLCGGWVCVAMVRPWLPDRYRESVAVSVMAKLD